MNLNAKNILLIAPRFFDYELEIQNALEKLGASVDFFDDRPDNNFLTKVFIRLRFTPLIKYKIKKHYDNICDHIKSKKYDCIFVVSPEALDRNKLEKIKLLQPDAENILYMYDSFSNKKVSEIIPAFDKVFTFDIEDAESFDLEFLPLFYIKDYENINKCAQYDYDLCFVATAHSDRYSIGKKIEEKIKSYKLTMFSFYFLNSRIMYWGRKLFFRKFAYGKIKDFSFKVLDKKKLLFIIEKSKVILDINHPRQRGLTMRTMEALGARKKMITTNQYIKSYDFFNENNILVIDRNDIKLPKDFFDTDYIQPSKEIYEKYSLDNWLKKIFDI